MFSNITTYLVTRRDFCGMIINILHLHYWTLFADKIAALNVSLRFKTIIMQSQLTVLTAAAFLQQRLRIRL